MNVAETLVEVLAEAGVRHLFGMPGDAVNGLLEAVRRQDRIRFVQVRHEEAGAFAASAQAKLSGELAACVGTAGPGAVHLLGGLYDAKLDHAPVIAVTGQVGRGLLGTDAHQEVDLDALFADVEVYGRTLAVADHLPDLAVRACRAAQSRRGVARITLPEDLTDATVAEPERRGNARVAPVERAPAVEALDRAAELLGAAARPVVLAGVGCRGATDELFELARRVGAPIVRSLRAKDIVPDDHALSLGGHGLLGTTPATEAFERCDALLLVGTDFPYRDFYPGRGPAAIQVEIDPERMGRRYPVDVALDGHVRPSLAGLLERVPARGEHAFLEECQESMQRWRELCARQEEDTGEPIRPQRLARLVGEAADASTIFACDTGAVTAWAARHLAVREGQRFTLSGNLASMAYGLPAAIGAALAFPGRRVVVLAGDGGLSMLPSDLLTAVRYGLPITVVVFDNGKLGLIQMEQEVEGRPEYQTALQSLDFAAFAGACGARGRNVEDPSELPSALRDAMAAEGPYVLSVRVRPDELTLPPRIRLDHALGFGWAKLRELLGQGDRESLAGRLGIRPQSVDDPADPG